jgi:hypothetical protein
MSDGKEILYKEVSISIFYKNLTARKKIRNFFCWFCWPVAAVSRKNYWLEPQLIQKEIETDLVSESSYRKKYFPDLNLLQGLKRTADLLMLYREETVYSIE